jgi:hypothetical protein
MQTRCTRRTTVLPVVRVLALRATWADSIMSDRISPQTTMKNFIKVLVILNVVGGVIWCAYLLNKSRALKNATLEKQKQEISRMSSENKLSLEETVKIKEIWNNARSKALLSDDEMRYCLQFIEGQCANEKDQKILHINVSYPLQAIALSYLSEQQKTAFAQNKSLFEDERLWSSESLRFLVGVILKKNPDIKMEAITQKLKLDASSKIRAIWSK